MARVKAAVKCFIGNAIREEGEVFDYDGPANGNVEPLDEARKSSKKASSGAGE